MDEPYLYQYRPVTKVIGYIYEVHLRGLLLVNVIPTAVEGSRLSFSQKKWGCGAASDEYRRVFFKFDMIKRKGIPSKPH